VEHLADVLGVYNVCYYRGLPHNNWDFMLQFSKIKNISCVLSNEGMVVIETLKWTQIFVYVRHLGLDIEDIKGLLG
jgi:hypothetical protein